MEIRLVNELSRMALRVVRGEAGFTAEDLGQRYDGRSRYREPITNWWDRYFDDCRRVLG